MKIYSTSVFEKLKIRPVNTSKFFNKNFITAKVDANKMHLKDLKLGYLCRTNEEKNDVNSNIWVCVDSDKMNAWFPGSGYFDYWGFVTVLYHINGTKLMNLPLEMYMNFPRHSTYSCYDILDVWKTTSEFFEELDATKTVNDFISFYKKYNLKDL